MSLQVLIGGPLDGRKVWVPDDANVVRVPVIQDVVAYYGQGTFVVGNTFAEYRRRSPLLGNADGGETLPLFVHSDLSLLDAVSLLLDHYAEGRR